MNRTIEVGDFAQLEGRMDIFTITHIEEDGILIKSNNKIYLAREGGKWSTFIDGKFVSIINFFAKEELKYLDVDKYFTFSRLLGSGTFSNVFLVKLLKPFGNLISGQLLALKIYNKSYLDIKYILNEIEILQSLFSNPNILHYYDHFLTTIGGNITMVMLTEVIPGEDLFYVIRQNYLPVNENIKYMKSLVSALKYIHDHNVVHRDIKPENIMITLSNVPKYIDFGHSCFTISVDHSICITRAGTLQFLSPELYQTMGIRNELPTTEALRAGDVWALGLVFYELLFRKQPDETIGKIPPILTREIEISFPQNTNVDPVLMEIVKGMVERDVTKRSSIEEVITNLNIF